MTVFLIAGGAGFVGSNFARFLVKRGDTVHVLVRPSSDLGRLMDFENKVTIHTCDLGNQSTLRPILSSIQPDVVAHMAATIRSLDNDSLFNDAKLAFDDAKNLMNMLSVCEDMIRPPALFLRAGSIAEYGDCPLPCVETQPLQPRTPYAAGKAFEYYLTNDLRSKLSFPIINTRLALIYGADQSSKFLIPQLIAACLNSKVVNVRYPATRRDLIHIDDVVAAISLLTDRPPTRHRTANISTGVSPTNRKVAELIIKFSGAPDSAITFGAESNLHQNHDLFASPALMKKLYGWSAKFEIERGLQQLICKQNQSPEKVEVQL